MSTELTLDVTPPVARATFQTTDGLNVLSSAVIDRIAAVVAEVREAAGVRALVLAAEGKVFVAGADIKELSELDSSAARGLSERGSRAFDALAQLPFPTIARLHGAALGGGLEVALACDFRIALRSAKVGLPETALGLVPGWRGISRMAALVRPAMAKRLMFGATIITAEEGFRLGLIDDIVADPVTLDQRIEALIAELQRGGPKTVEQIKRAMAGGDEVQAFANCFGRDESREGMAAFLEKRPANWMKGS